MDSLWKKLSRERQNMTLIQSDACGPYMEEEQTKEGIRINAWYRYRTLLAPLLENSEVSGKAKAYLFDLIMHGLIELEFHKDITAKEYGVIYTKENIQQGLYGAMVQRKFRLFDEDEKHYIAHMVYEQEKTEETLSHFSEAVMMIFKGAAVYSRKGCEKSLLLCMNRSENKRDERKAKVLAELLLPFGYEMTVFWDNPFAVIGVPETMQCDKIHML